MAGQFSSILFFKAKKPPSNAAQNAVRGGRKGDGNTSSPESPQTSPRRNSQPRTPHSLLHINVLLWDTSTAPFPRQRSLWLQECAKKITDEARRCMRWVNTLAVLFRTLPANRQTYSQSTYRTFESAPAVTRRYTVWFQLKKKVLC